MKESDPIIDSPYYRNFLYFFNVKRDFYECHEHGEYLWLNSGSSDFLKGLIQLAVSLYHLGQGNKRGAAIMLERGTRYLSAFPTIYEGIHIPSFVSDVTQTHMQILAENHTGFPHQVALSAPLIQIVDPDLAEEVNSWYPVELPDEDLDD